MPYFNIVAETSKNTVVTEYEPAKSRSANYQSETALENAFIKMLTQQGYEYLKIRSEDDLLVNLRQQIEKLNDYQFSATEWDRFFHRSLANKNEGIVEKTRKIQEDHIQVLKRDDGSSKNIMLIDKKIFITISSKLLINMSLAKEKELKEIPDTMLRFL